MNILLLVLGLLLFFGLVVVHEFGHFIMARRNGVKVLEFGIGFPPRLFKHRTKQGWIFSVNLLPLGGFVRLKGEHDVDDQPGDFGAASLPAKVQIMAAGVVMNLIAAYLILVLLALIGLPQLVSNQFTIRSDTTYSQHAKAYIAAGSIESNSPAAQTGIKTDDAIVAFGPTGALKQINSIDTLPSLTQKYAGQTVIIEYRQGANGSLQQKLVTLRSVATVQAARAKGNQIGYLGVSVYPAQAGLTVARSTWSAPIVAAGVMTQYTALTFAGLGKAIAGVAGIIAGTLTGNISARQAAQTTASSQVGGPVAIFFVFKYGSALGYRFILFIVAVVSLTLAIMNLLPIPALDGGRMWILLFTRAIRRPLTQAREEAINLAGLVFLFGLIILITIVDVRRFL